MKIKYNHQEEIHQEIQHDEDKMTKEEFKLCQKQKAKKKEYRLKNKEKVALQKKEYYQKNKEKILQYQKEYKRICSSNV